MARLHRAVKKGNLKKVEELIDRGANMDARDMGGQAPLSAALGMGQAEAASLLIQRGADVNTRDLLSVTPLHVAVGMGLAEMVQLLIERGADVNVQCGRVQDDWGGTPLHWAARNGRIDIVKLLLERGADVDAPREDGTTSLDNAEEYGHNEIAELLRQHGAVEACGDSESMDVDYHQAAAASVNTRSKQEIIREIEQLGSTDFALKTALSPLLSALQSGSPVNYAMSASTLNSLAESFEKTGTADAATITKLRQIEAELKML